MIVQNVRVVAKEKIEGHQREESFIKYYDVQIYVFDNWWSLDEDLPKCLDLQEAIDKRDEYMTNMGMRNG